MSIRGLICEQALALLDARYVHMGRNPSGQGVDCVGNVVVSCQRAGLPIADVADYSPHPDPEMLMREMRSRADEIGWDQLQPADVLVLGATRREPAHIGLVTRRFPDGVLRMSHATRKLGKVVEEPLDGRWRKMCVACFKLHGVD